ncbi:hypothetical protein J2S74_000931 [Evansella vedderi]|uniref:Uncharacterized protein n=1 Tax=Evansella vedderi TaxID=38282 RepID=A0ABT9ZQP0_9BACI|nr:hypothetical protein [Evansella vedderi]MDQ0253559.1 hypothetical protein [Evansella vedderi]
MKRSTEEVSVVSKSYWITSMVLFLVGYFLTNYGAYNPLFTLVLLAPIPFIFGLLEVFKGREQGLLEMEMACKFSAHEIILARLFLVGMYNITLNSLLAVSFVPLVDSTTIWEMFLIWFTPFTIFAALALALSMRFRGTVFVTTFFSLWLIFIGLLLNHHAWTAHFFNANTVMYFLLMGVGMLLLAIQVRMLIRKYSTYEEGRTLEANY